MTFQLRLFNLFGLFFLRNEIGITKGWVAAYFAAWMGAQPQSFRLLCSISLRGRRTVCSFLFPQPSYLGPHKLKVLTPEVCAHLRLPQAAKLTFRSAVLRQAHPPPLPRRICSSGRTKNRRASRRRIRRARPSHNLASGPNTIPPRPVLRRLRQKVARPRAHPRTALKRADDPETRLLRPRLGQGADDVLRFGHLDVAHGL